MNFRKLLSSGRVGLVGMLGAGGLFLSGCDDCGEEETPDAQAPGNVADNAVVDGGDPLEAWRRNLRRGRSCQTVHVAAVHVMRQGEDVR